jgi:DNA-binding NtrC family response regulator
MAVDGSVRVLVVDDQASVAQAMERTLQRNGFAVTTFLSPIEGLGYLTGHLDEVDVILLDVDMPEMPGLVMLAQIKELDCAAPVIMWTADVTALTATKAMHAGAFTYVTKPVEHVDSFVATLHGAASFCALRRHARSLERQIAHSPLRPVGESSVMRALRDRLDRLARSDVTILIQGESGTGKELVARSIHDRSPRATAPFVALNCGAISEALIDSELFGHTRGAFTGAVSARPGVFVEADGGTLFLDEIAEMPLPVQARLLRVLQEREIRAVGADGVRKVDVRVVAATHADLKECVDDKLFRADLYYRLNVATIDIPPLRDRSGDIPVLTAHLLAKHRPGGTLTPAALAVLTGYAWPGNVRELENALLHALALSGDVIDDVALPVAVRSLGRPSAPHLPEDLAWSAELSLTEAKKRAINDFERRYVTNVLTRTKGNLTQAARISGLDRANLRRTLQRLGIDADQFRLIL